MADKERIVGLLNGYRDEIRARSPKSLAIWQKNRTVMPAGVGSIFRLSDPFPMVVKRASGARLWDADDNEYLDFMLGFSVMILGNAPDEVQAAIREALPRGTHYGQCHEHEYAFARLICDMVPGIDKVSFCNSGTEATMYALRLARATTWRAPRQGAPWLPSSRVDITVPTICWPPALAGRGQAPSCVDRSRIRHVEGYHRPALQSPGRP